MANFYIFSILIVFQIMVCSSATGQGVVIKRFASSNGLREQLHSTNGKDSVVIPAENTMVSFFFEDSLDNETAVFSYQLEGLESVYHIGRAGDVTYSNLIGGYYIFRVSNRNFSGFSREIPFYIEKAFWQRPWFAPMIIAYLLLVLGVILFVFRILRLRSQLRLQNLRNEIASDLHDDVGTTLSSISFLGEMARIRLESKPDEVPGILDKIILQSNEMMQTMRGMVWTIQPNNDNAIDFFDKVKQFAEGILRTKQIELYFEVKELGNPKLDLEVQRNLLLVFKESIVNIVKYAEANEVKIIIQRESQHLWILIKDNGKGFDTSTASDGNGLNNIRKRTLHIGGELAIESVQDKGTSVKMVVPIA